MSPGTPSARLAELADRYWRFHCHEWPLYAVLAGERTPDGVLFRESLDDFDRRNRTAAALLEELDRIELEALAPQDRATHQLLRRELESIGGLYGVMAHLRPSLFPTGPTMMLSFFANSSSIDDLESADRYLDRLATVPAWLGDLGHCLGVGHDQGIRYPRMALARTIGAVRAALAGPVEASPWSGPFRRSPAAAREDVRQRARRAEALITDELIPAFEAFAGFLEEPLAEGARSTISCTDAPLGRELYRVLARDFTTTELSPEEIHELGLSEVDRIERAMQDVAAEAGYPGDLPGYRRFLASERFVAPSKEALREQLEVLCKRIDGRIPTYFGRIPRITYGVESIPEAAAEQLPPAYAQPSPADRSSAGLFWITSLPERCPASMHLPIALHEAWPGHLMHIALTQESDELPAFRRHGAIRYPACVEGWAIYCESLGVDMGLYATPHQHYGRLDMEMWRALRLVVDTGIHWFSWSRERAVETMAERMALPRPTIEAEVDRYVCWPGQALAYQIGNLEFRGLRALAESRLGARFALRAFHDELLSAGPASLPVLRDLVELWVDGVLSQERNGAPDARA